jgi:MIP family channel proteins
MLRRYGAEFFGTFAYVFFGCGVGILAGNAQDAASRLLVYLTFGLVLFTMTYALSHLSAAPFNPAVTLGLAIARRFPWRYVWPYWLAQIAGAVSASLVHQFLLPRQAQQALYDATLPTIGTAQTVIVEGLITFFLMFVVMSTATERRVNRAAVGLATGLTVTLAGLFAGPLTGGSLNPARSTGPALFAGGHALATLWMYWVGPLLGATAGALVYEYLRGDETFAMEAPEHIFDGLRHPREKGSSPSAQELRSPPIECEASRPQEQDRSDCGSNLFLSQGKSYLWPDEKKAEKNEAERNSL